MRYSVTVKPGSSQQKIVKNEAGDLIVYLHAKAHGGEANQALTESLSEYFRVPKTKIKILRGEKSRKKVVEFEN